MSTGKAGRHARALGLARQAFVRRDGPPTDVEMGDTIYGDISIELTQGTFLTSFDTESTRT